ncbi:MAG: ThiF family adenylyltransferase [Acidobacteriota bacterium]|nr:ThiF family adenylyltransferase [Acidobacteriota bacterium]
MEDQVDSQLESEYAAATTRAREFVAIRYLLEECEQTSPDYPKADIRWREVWRVRMAELPGTPDFILAVPMVFPDRLPKVYLTASTAAELRQIPHLDNKRFLCGYDEEMAKPDADNPEGIVISVLERAAKVFNDGLSGANEPHYLQELQAYWTLDCDFEALSLIDPLSETHSVTMLSLEPNWRGYSCLFAHSEEDGTAWLKAVSCSSKVKADKILFLHFQTLGNPPFPRTNGEMYQLLRQHNPSNLKLLLTHLRRSRRPSAILFSAPTNGDARMMGAWWHPVTAHEVNRGPGHHRRHRGVVPGFGSATSDIAVTVELSMQHKQARLRRASIERVDKARLFERSVGRRSLALEKPVNIIGCGSLGSFSAACLAQSGAVDDFRMVDPQKLEPANVQRHYCGMSGVGELKVDVTKRKLGAHFPHIKCDTHAKDVLELIRASPSALTPSSLTLVTVADIAIDRRLNQLLKNTSSLGGGPLCFLWVEPHLIAGHAIFLRPELTGCFECAFDQEFHFKHRVLCDPEQFAQREAGCQSTFMPYSGLDATQFIAAATRFLIESIQADENRLFSWIGDIEYARRNGLALEERWQSAQPFSLHLSPLAPNTSCAVCGANDGTLSTKRERVRAAFR